MDVGQQQLKTEFHREAAANFDEQHQHERAQVDVKGINGSNLSVSRKRNRSEEGEREDEIEKRGCEEGMSWWTCLMLGISQDNSRQQVVRKLHNLHEK